MKMNLLLEILTVAINDRNNFRFLEPPPDESDDLDDFPDDE
jgi:hypothetical protein